LKKTSGNNPEGRADPDLEDALHILEFPAILDTAAGYARTSMARDRILHLPFHEDAGMLRRELDRVTEMRNLLEAGDPFVLEAFPDFKPVLKKNEIPGAYLNPREAFNLLVFLRMVRRIRAFLDSRREEYPLCYEMSSGLAVFKELEKDIESVVDGSGEVKDNASGALHRLRRELEKLSANQKERLNAILRKLNASGYTQENLLVLREGRLVIPMKEEHQHDLQGIVLDQSSSGATVFMEPLESIEIGNEIRRLRLQEEKEIERILIQLADGIRTHQKEISRNQEVCVELDNLAARARFSLSIRGIAAEINTEPVLDLWEARHPLLLLRNDQSDVVPISLSIGKTFKTLVITGPNAGGKTVSIKTVGLLACMHQHGMHVSASEGTRLPLFPSIFADIGDQQSIEQDLSTFSSHIRKISRILKNVRGGSLVLLDEIGSSTDPSEGAALAESVLLGLTRAGALTLATTHIGELKIFAHQTGGVENGSMVFDQKTLKPTYRFQLGVPGSSYAFEIAGQHGFPTGIIEEAKARLGEERGRIERMISDLEKERQSLHEARAKSERDRSELEGLTRLYKEKLERVQEQAEARRRQILSEAEAFLDESNSRIEKIIQEIRETNASREAIRRAKEMLRERGRTLKGLAPVRKKEELPVRKGDRVIWDGHGGAGEVVSSPDAEGRVTVLWNDVRLKIKVRELKSAGQETGPASARKTGGSTRYTVEEAVPVSVDLRGMRADEAVEAVDRYLGRAAVSGLGEVMIIHGKGDGILQKVVTDFVSAHPLVRKHRRGRIEEGDAGVTVVMLK
jgi:DNA mismatch repair protein MutS2